MGHGQILNLIAAPPLNIIPPSSFIPSSQPNSIPSSWSDDDFEIEDDNLESPPPSSPPIIPESPRAPWAWHWLGPTSFKPASAI